MLIKNLELGVVIGVAVAYFSIFYTFLITDISHLRAPSSHKRGNGNRVFFRGGGGGGGAFAILLYIYCNVQHVALAPPGMQKQLFCPPLSKILNAALNPMWASNHRCLTG